jgi:hypothetical protein
MRRERGWTAGWDCCRNLLVMLRRVSSQIKNE